MARHRNDEDLPYIIVERSGDDGGGLLPFLWGALVGAGVALLFAPRSGAETRAELSSGARRLREAAEETVRGVQESVTGAVAGAVDGVREQVTGRVSVARNAYDAGRSAARESRAQMEARIREARMGFEAGAAAARDGDEFTDEDLDEEDL